MNPCRSILIRFMARGGLMVGAPAAALAQPGPCFPVNAEGHPLFPTPTVRVDRETAISLAGHASFGDLNHDGLLDAVVAVPAQPFPSFVSICFNRGSGVFGPPVHYAAGNGTCAVEMGDLNRDGWLDLVVASSEDDTASILFNQRDGTFSPPVAYPVGASPRSLKVADLQGDGWLDVVTLDTQDHSVSVLINAGGGTLRPRNLVPVFHVTQQWHDNPAGPFLALADLNGNGRPDIAVPDEGGVWVLWNDGRGNFTAPPAYLETPFGWGYCIVPGDFDHSGALDLAVTMGPFVILATGNGMFGPAARYQISPVPPQLSFFPLYVDAGSLRGNGWPDLVIGSEFSHGQICVMHNRADGSGSFGPIEYVHAGDPCWFVALRDLRHTGLPDLVSLTATQRSGLAVNLNDGAGRLLSGVQSPPIPTGLSGSQFGMAAADLDGDGAFDAAVCTSAPEGQVRLFRGRGDGAFDVAGLIRLGASPVFASGVAAGDLNGDGRLDLVVSDQVRIGGTNVPGRIWAIAGAGGFAFAEPVPYPLEGVTPYDPVLADLNGDGRLDIVVWSLGLLLGSGQPREQTVQVLLNRGDGTFSSGTTYHIGLGTGLPMPAHATVADLDGDGRPDLAAAFAELWSPGLVVTLHNRGDGSYEPWRSIPVAPQPVWIGAADFAGRGRRDLAVVHEHGSLNAPMNDAAVTLLLNDGAGGFSRTEYVQPDVRSRRRAVIADFNGDGRPDLAFSDLATFSMEVMLNQGRGALGRPVGYTVTDGVYAGEALGVTTGDFDGNGRADLLVSTREYVSFLPNIACRSCYPDCDGNGTLNASDFACFLARFAAGDPRANCDSSDAPPTLTVADFVCFMQRFAAGCP